jgi:hypothetical protein
MCLGGMFKQPEVKPLPVTPNIDDDAVRRQQALEEERLRQNAGSAGTRVSDLNPNQVTGQQRTAQGVKLGV